MFRQFKIVDGYCVDEHGMRVGIVRVIDGEFGSATEIRHIEFYDDRFIQTGNDVRLRLGKHKVIGKIQLA